MTFMHGLLSARVVATLASLALIIAGCTAGTDTTYVNAGFQDQPPADSLQDGLSGTPQSGDPAPIVQGLTLPTTSQQTGQGQQNTPSGGSGASSSSSGSSGTTPSGFDGG